MPFFRVASVALLFLLIAVPPALGQAEQSDDPKTSQEEDPKSKDDNIKLRVGDPAPPLVVDEWMQGEPISEYAKDKFYIVEFWATWCAPCIKAMPHLSDIAKQYENDGLEVVALTSSVGNPKDAVQAFVEKRGKDLHFRFGFCATDDIEKSFMQAAGKQAIPCSFVIDRKGKIAYIGLPHDLDYVISRVAKNKWRGQADVDELENMNQSIGNLVSLAQSDLEKAVALVKHIEKVNPKRALGADFVLGKTVVLCHSKRFDEAKAEIEIMKQKSSKSGDWTAVASSVGILGSKQLNPKGVHVDFVDSTFQELQDIADGNFQLLLQLGSGYGMAGKTEEAIKSFEDALKLSPNEAMNKPIKQIIENLKRQPTEQTPKP
ncbi:MAG: redoxin family protein [Planctomycetota bacterium]